MACGATLKRSLEFDPLHSPSPKRRRCIPVTLSPSAPPTKLHQGCPSPFSEVLTPRLTSERIAISLTAELKKMQRRKQLHFPRSVSPPLTSDIATTSSADSGSTLQSSPSSPSTMFNSLSPSKKDTPLFTFRQVSLICERMVKEREDQIREEYDTVLTNKLAEQYEAFLKFNHDQLHKRFGDAPMSYVS